MQIENEPLVRLILKEISHEKTESISFSRFMTLALYEPTLGYYTASFNQFGKEGDFTTAPGVSPAFASCLAHQCQEVLSVLGGGVIFEIGAGTGELAADLLLFLEKEQTLPEQYQILEISPSLRQYQKVILRKRVPHLLSRVRWMRNWPTSPIQGIIIANEVLDALPVDRFFWSGDAVQEMRVGIVNKRLAWCLVQPSSMQLAKRLHRLKADYFPEVRTYLSEICLDLPVWINKLSQSLKKGLVLIIDYGFPAREYYHPQRYNGTLLCHYRHRAHTDPLTLIGLQDITSSVDFTYLAWCAQQVRLEVRGFTSQAAFLMNNGLLRFVEECYNKIPSIDIGREVCLLTSPNEMGELVKVLGLTRRYMPTEIRGFSCYERRSRL